MQVNTQEQVTLGAGPLKGTVTQNISILKYDYTQCVDVCMLCALKSLVGKLLEIHNSRIFL